MVVAAVLAMAASVVLLTLVAIHESLRHWFIAPVVACGLLIGRDLIAWVCGRREMFDPGCLFALVGVNFFIAAPIAHVVTGYYLRTPIAPEDWRPWLGVMAILNAIGLLLYRMTSVWWEQRCVRLSSQRPSTLWSIRDTANLRYTLGIALAITAMAQVAVYVAYGGIGGYLEAYTQTIGAGDERAFTGMGWVFMVAESFPILLFMTFALWVRRRQSVPGWAMLLLALAVFVVLRLIFGGFRGSRGNTIWAVFWAVGIIHYFIRPVPKALLAAGIPLLIGFMYTYGFFKAVGTDVITVLRDDQARREVEATSGRTIDMVIMGDLARADVQAYIVYSLINHRESVQLGYGRSYIGDVAILIPRAIWPDRPPTKMKEGSLLLRREWQPEGGADRVVSTNVFGLSGEGMLNFGMAAVPFGFILYGLLIGWMRAWITSLDSGDVRRLLVPLLITLAMSVFIADLDNTVFMMVKNGAIPVLVIVFTAAAFRTDQAARSAFVATK